MSMHLRAYKSSWDSAGVLCKVKAVRKFAVSLFLPLGTAMGMFHSLVDTGMCPVRCQCAVKQHGQRGSTSLSPEPRFLCKYKHIWGCKAVIRYELKPFFTHRRDEQSPNTPNNMFRVILTSQKGFAPLFPGKQLCLQGNNSKKVALESFFFWMKFLVSDVHFNEKIIHI